MSALTTAEIEKQIRTDLILPADVRRIHHVVAPVLLLDLVLLFTQELQLFVAALRVIVETVQVLAAQFGFFLKERVSKKKCILLGNTEY